MWRHIADLPFLVILMGISAVSMFVPAFHALILNDHAVGRAFLYSGAIILIIVAMIAIATAQYRPRDAARSHLWAMVAAYLVLPVILAVPLTQPGAGAADFGAAWFEMLSSFTTTGATLFMPDELPQSVHLWRALVGWLGGFFVILMAVAVLAPLNLGGTEVISGRAPGHGASGAAQISKVADPSERIIRYTLVLFPAYGGLTLLLWVGLIMAGDTSFVALCHAMSTLSTSGISPVGGLQNANSGFVGEAFVFIVLITAISRQFLTRGIGRQRDDRILNDVEVRLAMVLLAFVPTVLFLRHWLGADVAAAGPSGLTELLTTFWGGLFMTMSFLTTTGFESSHWHSAQVWSGMGAPGMVLIGLAIVGGGVATTAGGVRLLRVYALIRHGERELDRVIHPNSVGGSGQAARHLRRQGAYVAWVFFMLFAATIAVFTAALTLTSLEFEPALVLALAALTTTGPLAGLASDTVFDFANLNGASLSVVGVAMVVGRVETLAILALLAPDSWRR